MNKNLQKEIDERVKLLSYIVTCEMARGGGKPMNGEMLLIFEALQDLYEKSGK